MAFGVYAIFLGYFLALFCLKKYSIWSLIHVIFAYIVGEHIINV